MSDNCRDLFFTETTATALATYSAYIGDGINTTYNITHNLNSEDVTYSLRDVQSDILGYAQVNVTSPNTVTVSFDDPPALTAFYFTIFAGVTAKQVTGFEDRITVNVTQPLQDISVNVADTSEVVLVSPDQDVVTITTNVQSIPGVTIDVGVTDVVEPVTVNVDTAATAWGTIIGTLSAQTDLWKYLSAETFSPSQLTAFLNSNAISLCSINVNGVILSAGTNLFDIFLTSETDSQTLSYTPSSYNLSISNGNTVNLSSIIISPNANAIFQTVSALALSGIFYGDGSNLTGVSQATRLKVLTGSEVELDAGTYSAFVKLVTGSNSFTFTNFTSGKTITLYLSADHLNYTRHYLPQPTFLNKAGEANTVFSFNNYVTKVILQNTGTQYLGTANIILLSTSQVTAPLGNSILLDGYFGYMKQQNQSYLLLQ